MRASRLLTILTLLQAKGQVTASALARECEVSLRTIYRDVDALSAAGIPIYSVQGNGGGYRLLQGYRVRLNGMSSSEADVLFLAGLTRQAADLGLGAIAASVRSKLLAALPEELRSGATRSRFHFDAPAWFAESEAVTHLPLVAEAVFNQRPLLMRYQSRTADRERRVEPLGIVLKAGVWYLVARSGPDLRTFRIARIRDVTVLDERFTEPPDFDLEAYWTASTKRYEDNLHQARAEIRLSPRGRERMDDVLPPQVRRGAVIAEEADPKGWRRVTLSVGSLSLAAIDLLRFGPEAEVLGPPALRAEMTRLIGELTGLYALPAPVSANAGTVPKRADV